VKKVLKLLDKEKFQNKDKEGEVKIPVVVIDHKTSRYQPAKMPRVPINLSKDCTDVSSLQKFLQSMYEYSTDLVKDKSCSLSDKKNFQVGDARRWVLIKGIQGKLGVRIKGRYDMEKCVYKVSLGHELEVWKPALTTISHEVKVETKKRPDDETKL
jgi:hypothetical protein